VVSFRKLGFIDYHGGLMADEFLRSGFVRFHLGDASPFGHYGTADPRSGPAA